MASRRAQNDVVSLLNEELAAYPGRLAGSLRDTLGVVLALTIAMTLRVPGISLALALLFLMQRERPGLTLRVALQIFSGAVVACTLTFFWVQITDGSEVMRFLGIVIGVFVAAFCMASTTIPLFWTIFGFYGLVDLTGWDAHRSPDAIVTASLSNLASLGLVVICAVGVEYSFGTRHPAEEIASEMNKRLIALERFFRTLSEPINPQAEERLRANHHLLMQYSHAGDLYFNELYDRLRGSSQSGSKIPLGIHYRIGLLTRVLHKAVVFGFPGSREQASEFRDTSRKIADLCTAIIESSSVAAVSADLEGHPSLLREILLELEQYSQSLHPSVTSPSLPISKRVSLPFQHFVQGAFDTPDAAFYALKLTLAATVCYVIYNAVAWPGILTCVVTVLFTGLSSTGAMRQKQLYRFLGAALGGALAIAIVSLLYPNMDSITSLVVTVAPIAFLSGWVLRSPHIGYVGVQIGFAFFLTALPGFSAATQIAPARDRVIGVALGIVVMWFIFDQLWPTRTSDALKAILVRVRLAGSRLAAIRNNPNTPENVHLFQNLRSSVSADLATMQQLNLAARFESGRHRKREVAKSRRLIQEIEKSSGEFYSAALDVSPQ